MYCLRFNTVLTKVDPDIKVSKIRFLCFRMLFLCSKKTVILSPHFIIEFKYFLLRCTHKNVSAVLYLCCFRLLHFVLPLVRFQAGGASELINNVFVSQSWILTDNCEERTSLAAVIHYVLLIRHPRRQSKQINLQNMHTQTAGSVTSHPVPSMYILHG